MPITMTDHKTGQRRQSNRKISQGDIRAEALVKAYKGLPKDMHYLQLLNVFMAAAPALNLSRTAKDLYVYLFRKTNIKDWNKRRLAIVWPSDEDIKRDLGIAERKTVQIAFRQLRNIGLLAYKDSPTKQRMGRRHPDGTIDYGATYGIILNSIAGLVEDLTRIANDYATKCRYKHTIRKTITSLRRERDEKLLAAKSVFSRHVYQKDAQAFAVLDTQISESGRDYGLKERLIDSYRALLDDLCTRIAQETANPLDAYETASKDELDAMKLFMQKEHRAGSLNNSTIRTITTPTPTIGNRLSDESSRGEGGDRADNQAPVERDTGHTYAKSRISLDQVVATLPYDVSSEVRDDFYFMQVYDLLKERCSEYGVPLHVLEEARTTMGIERACACMAVIMAKEGKLRKPGNYFLGLIHKYRDGALRIERSMFGIIKEKRNTKTVIGELDFE